MMTNPPRYFVVFVLFMIVFAVGSLIFPEFFQHWVTRPTFAVKHVELQYLEKHPDAMIAYKIFGCIGIVVTVGIRIWFATIPPESKKPPYDNR